MDVKHQQLKTNLQQQTKRLLDQLKELEENKEDLTQQQYDEIKHETIEALKTFQNSLNNMLADPNNSVLESEIEKTKRSLFEAVKLQFNKEEVIEKLLSEQAKGTRTTISELEKRLHLKTMSEAQFVGKKRKLIVQIEETGAKLTEEEADWLQLHHHFAEKGNEEVKSEIQKNQVKIAQKKMEGNI